MESELQSPLPHDKLNKRLDEGKYVVCLQCLVLITTSRSEISRLKDEEGNINDGIEAKKSQLEYGEFTEMTAARCLR